MRDVIDLGHPSALDWVLMAGEAGARSAVSLDAVTRVTLTLGEQVIDSAVVGFGAGQAFDPTVTATPSNGDLRGKTVDVLRLRLGTVAGLAAGKYLGKLTVYDAANPGGIVWGDPRAMEVR